MKKISIPVILIMSFITLNIAGTVPPIEGRPNKNDTINNNISDIQNINIVIVYDNNPYKEGLKAAWGFSCLIKGTDKTILFDTGGDGSILLANMDKLNINPNDIDMVVLSHIHSDHVGGLLSLIEKNENITVYMPNSFPVNLKKRVKALGTKVIDVSVPVQICENIHSTGELGTHIKEQSLIVRTPKGLILISGCAHPGIVNIIKEIKKLYEDNVLLVMGGFHLYGEGKYKIESIISSFKKLQVLYVAPCHCSGETARELFEKAYQQNFIDAGVGKVIALGDLK